MNKAERIMQINAAYEAEIAAINQRRDYRWQNYLDCVDDYSVCGLCDKADSMAEWRAKTTRDILLQQVENDGHFVQMASEYVLLDMNDNIVSDNLFHGHYGLCFKTAEGYVGVPKKMSTLTKKGYQIGRLDRTFKCVFGGWSNKDRLLFKNIELMSELLIVGDELPTCVPDNYITWAWRCKNQNS